MGTNGRDASDEIPNVVDSSVRDCTWWLIRVQTAKGENPAEDAQSMAESRKEDYLTAALAGLVRNGRDKSHSLGGVTPC
jgi:hypothetical protein